MKKITSFKLDLKTGGFIEEEQKIRIKNFDDGEAAIFFREFLLKKGLIEHLGTTVVNKGRWGKLQYLTLFGKPLKIRFCLWAAQKDTEGGKGVLWVGERNTAKYKQEEINYGIIVGDRLVRNDVLYYLLIVTTRTFRIGTSLSEQPFVEFLLMPIEDIIEEARKSGKGWVDIRRSHREKYAFDKMLDRLRLSI